ncbi:MAG: MaoC family dehydratase [Nocardioides sp.]
MRVFNGADEVTAAIGEHLGYSEWLTVDQKRINTFAEATGDFQWIHVDVEKAAAGPFGTTIAHGYLTLSLVPLLGQEVFTFTGWPAALNYGTEKVRFLTPVKVDSRIRAGVEIVAAEPSGQGLRVVLRYTVEIEGEPRPACVAETVVLLLG